MKLIVLAVALTLLGFGGADAQPAALKPELAGLAFLTGDWTSGRGTVADTGGTATGDSRVEAAANGAVLLRRDRTNLFDAAGKPTGSFEQIMMIYAEGGTLRADYADGTHVIHYTSASVTPGKAVVFLSAASAGPIFRLEYTLTGPATLAVAFSMAPPGGGAFHPIATGTLTRRS